MSRPDPSELHSPATADVETYQEQFLNTVSHGLRTPLMAISTAAQLLSAEAAGPLTDPQRRQVDRIRSSSQDMHDRVSDLLELSLHQADRVALFMRPLDLDACVTEAIACQAPKAAARGITLLHAPSAMRARCLGDAARIVHVLRNLLCNAVRFTPPTGSIRVGVTHDGPWLRCRVEDTGCGIAPDEIATLFEPFYQARNEGGDRLGIGLSVAKAIVERHGGTLSVESRLGVGTTVSFTLPREGQPLPGSAAT